MLGRKSSAFCDKLFDMVVETAFQLHMGTIWAEKHSDENLTFSCSDIERNVFTFVRKLFDWVVRTAFHLAKGIIFWEVSALSFRPFFRTLSKKSPWFCRLFINWVVKTAFVVSIRAPRVVYFFWKKLVEFCLSLSDSQTEKYCFLTKIYRHVCQKCILTVHWNNLRSGFLWKSFLASFRALAKNIRFFLE